MKKCAFISRHVPTTEQVALAQKAGYTLVHVGDCDAFDREALKNAANGYTSACVVHPAAALYLRLLELDVLVFKNENRAPVGSPPVFNTVEVNIFTNYGELVYRI